MIAPLGCSTVAQFCEHRAYRCAARSVLPLTGTDSSPAALRCVHEWADCLDIQSPVRFMTDWNANRHKSRRLPHWSETLLTILPRLNLIMTSFFLLCNDTYSNAFQTFLLWHVNCHSVMIKRGKKSKVKNKKRPCLLKVEATMLLAFAPPSKHLVAAVEP